MKTKKQNKAGFTLVELMVVAIIVAILAAVAIPLMSGNKNRAAATEAQAACSTIKTGIRMMQVEGKTFPADTDSITGINDGDLEGNYFADSDYEFTGTAAYSNYTVSATASKGTDGISGKVTMQVADGADVTWGGSLLK